MVTLSPDQLDAIRELFNVGVGQAAGMLNQMLDISVKLRVPHVFVLRADEVLSVLGEFGRRIGGCRETSFPRRAKRIGDVNLSARRRGSHR